LTRSKNFFEIKVNYDAVARGNVSLHTRAAGPDWQFTEINGRFYATAG
jgi:hypothetical protein